MAYKRLEITKLADIWVTFYEYDNLCFVLQQVHLQKERPYLIFACLFKITLSNDLHMANSH